MSGDTLTTKPLYIEYVVKGTVLYRYEIRCIMKYLR